MTLKELLKIKNITAYSLSKESGVPFSTISDLINGKTKPENVRLCHAISISKALGIDVVLFAKLQNPKDELRFAYFRSNILHDLKRKGDIPFVQHVLKTKIIDREYKCGCLERALYLLALIEYLNRVNGNVMTITRYKNLKKLKLDSVLFPGSELISFSSVEEANRRIGIKCISEFAKYNIIEESVRNVA